MQPPHGALEKRPLEGWNQYVKGQPFLKASQTQEQFVLLHKNLTLMVQAATTFKSSSQWPFIPDPAAQGLLTVALATELLQNTNLDMGVSLCCPVALAHTGVTGTSSCTLLCA